MDVKREILEYVGQFSYCFHFRGHEQLFWENNVRCVSSCGCPYCAVKFIDIGVVMSQIFLDPLRHRINDCVLNQSVVSVLFDAQWRPPHLCQNGAQMCLDSLEGILTELDRSSPCD